jgi:hypothetical protein
MDKIKSTLQATALDSNTLQVISTPPTPDPVTTTYTLDFLQAKLIAIQKQADDFAQARQVELDEVNALISLCNDNGIVATPIVAEPPIMTPPIKL